MIRDISGDSPNSRTLPHVINLSFGQVHSTNRRRSRQESVQHCRRFTRLKTHSGDPIIVGHQSTSSESPYRRPSAQPFASSLSHYHGGASHLRRREKKKRGGPRPVCLGSSSRPQTAVHKSEAESRNRRARDAGRESGSVQLHSKRKLLEGFT